jgi:hypothetical protein
MILLLKISNTFLKEHTLSNKYGLLSILSQVAVNYLNPESEYNILSFTRNCEHFFRNFSAGIPPNNTYSLFFAI